MENNPKNGFSVESLLEEVQFSPSPAFQNRLFNQLHKQILDMNKDLQMQTTQSIKNHDNGRKKIPWKWVLSSTVFAMLVFVLMVSTVPGVQAQIVVLGKYFGVQLPFTSQPGLVVSPFTPLVPGNIPQQMIHFTSLNREADGPVYIELRYYSQNTFLVIYESRASAGFVRPEGETVRIGQMDVTANRNLNGMVFLAKQDPQPWRSSNGSGGGGGEGVEDSAAPPQTMVYHGATRLTWTQSGLEIEMLTNLPYEEALVQAGSLQPGPELNK